MKIGSLPPALDHAEQVRLAARARRGDAAARTRLIAGTLRYVLKMASRRVYVVESTHGSHLEDLFAVGAIALDRAITKYDRKKGANLTTYAHFWIRQAMDRYLEANSGPIFTTYRTQTAALSMDRRRTALACAGMSTTQIEDQIRRDFGDCAYEAATILRAKCEHLDHSRPGSKLPRSNNLSELHLSPDPDEAIDAQRRHTRVREVVAWFRASLSDQERVIFDHRVYSPRGHDPETYVAIGRRLGVSREQCRLLSLPIENRFRSVMRVAFSEEAPSASGPGLARAKPPRASTKPKPASARYAEVRPPVRRVRRAVNGVAIGDVVPPVTGKRHRSMTLVWPSKRKPQAAAGAGR